jgi:hypothetical protein
MEPENNPMNTTEITYRINEKVVDVVTGSRATIITTHTYGEENVRVASIKLEGNGSKWVLCENLKKIS